MDRLKLTLRLNTFWIQLACDFRTLIHIRIMAKLPFIWNILASQDRAVQPKLADARKWLENSACPHLILFRLLYVFMASHCKMAPLMHTLCKSYICLSVMGHVSTKELLFFLFLPETFWSADDVMKVELDCWHVTMGMKKHLWIVENRKCVHFTSSEFKMANFAIQILVDL